MITLFTGVPGAGKTAAMVDVLRMLAKDRVLFAAGLDGLKLHHVPVDPLKYHEEVPDGSVVVVDECQDFWPARASGAKVPESVAAMAKHRHTGTDFYLTCQHPGQIDPGVRALVGRHVHIRDVGLLGRWWYEWSEMGNPSQYKNAPTQKRYKLPKDVFSLYKSASVHTKPVRSVPRAVVYLVLLLLVMVAGGVYVYRSLQNKMAIPAPNAAASQPRPAIGMSFGGVGGPITGASMVASFKPRIASRDDSAPAYDALRVVVNMPRVVGGYCQGKRCKCITQQNTSAGLSNDECRAWLREPPFDPYYVAAPVQGQEPGKPGAPKVGPPPAMPMDLLASQ